MQKTDARYCTQRGRHPSEYPNRRALVDAELRRLRQAAYAELAALVGAPATREVAGADGKTYQIETEAVWDSKKVQEVRVIVTVDDGGWSAFKPITGSFIMRADDSLVPESQRDS